MKIFLISTAQQILFRFDDTIQICFAYFKKKKYLWKRFIMESIQFCEVPSTLHDSVACRTTISRNLFK